MVGMASWYGYGGARAYQSNNTLLQSAARAAQTCLFCKWNSDHVQLVVTWTVTYLSVHHIILPATQPNVKQPLKPPPDILRLWTLFLINHPMHFISLSPPSVDHSFFYSASVPSLVSPACRPALPLTQTLHMLQQLSRPTLPTYIPRPKNKASFAMIKSRRTRLCSL